MQIFESINYLYINILNIMIDSNINSFDYAEEYPKSNYTIIIVVVVLLLLAVVGVFFLFNINGSSNNSDNNPSTNNSSSDTIEEDNNSDNSDLDTIIENTITPTNTTTPSTSNSGLVSIAVPSNWKSVINQSREYTAYRPSNWYFRFFDTNRRILALDTMPIPDGGSDYIGKITISASSKSLANEIADTKKDLINISEEKRTHDNGTWTVLIATSPENLIESEYPVKIGIISSPAGKTFVVRYIAEDKSFDSVFDTLLGVIKFEIVTE
jgi:hypothetical protein